MQEFYVLPPKHTSKTIDILWFIVCGAIEIQLTPGVGSARVQFHLECVVEALRIRLYLHIWLTTIFRLRSLRC